MSLLKRLLPILKNNTNKYLVSNKTNTRKYRIPSTTSRASSLQVRCFAGVSSNTPVNGVIDFKLADIGEGIAECEILKWYVKVGDKIKQFEKVCEVQSDKATVEITSRYDGVVSAVHYSVGAMAKVGKPLISITLEGSESAAPITVTTSQSKSAPACANTPKAYDSASNNNDSSKILTTPAVRRLAKENNVDLTKVVATGPHDRILKEDMLNFIANKSAPLQTSHLPAPSVASTTTNVLIPHTHKPRVAYTLPLLKSDQKQQLGGLQRIMVQTMNAANAIPHFGFCEEIIMDQLVHMRATLKEVADKHNVKLSYMPFIIKATSLALREYPILNAHASADGTEVTLKASHNIGVAMNTPRGLIVPNVKDVQNKSIFEIAYELNVLQELGKESKLGREHLTGGTFSLSNIGTIGGTYASPLLVVPEVAIAALGRFQVVPRYNNKKEIHPVTTMAISYSGDHRVIDGATMANYSNLVKKYLENPILMAAVMH